MVQNGGYTTTHYQLPIMIKLGYLESKVYMNWKWFTTALSYEPHGDEFADPQDYMSTRHFNWSVFKELQGFKGPMQVSAKHRSQLGVASNLPGHDFDICFTFTTDLFLIPILKDEKCSFDENGVPIPKKRRFMITYRDWFKDGVAKKMMYALESYLPTEDHIRCEVDPYKYFRRAIWKIFEYFGVRGTGLSPVEISKLNRWMRKDFAHLSRGHTRLSSCWIKHQFYRDYALFYRKGPTFIWQTGLRSKKRNAKYETKQMTLEEHTLCVARNKRTYHGDRNVNTHIASKIATAGSKMWYTREMVWDLFYYFEERYKLKKLQDIRRNGPGFDDTIYLTSEANNN